MRNIEIRDLRFEIRYMKTGNRQEAAGNGQQATGNRQQWAAASLFLPVACCLLPVAFVHAVLHSRTKLASIFNPTGPDFSGWYCVAKTEPCWIVEAYRRP